MFKPWVLCELVLVKLILISLCFKTVTPCDNQVKDESALDKELKNYVDRVLAEDGFSLIPGIVVEKADNFSYSKELPKAKNLVNYTDSNTCDHGRSFENLEDYVHRKINQYAKTHVLSLNFEQTARFFSSGSNPIATAATATEAHASGKSTFLLGFGLGFIAFILSKILLPVFLGAQLIKSVLIAMFLPTILGGFGKIVGKGLSTFSGLSAASAGLNKHPSPQEEVDDFDFQETVPYNNNDAALSADIGSDDDKFGLKVNEETSTSSSNSRYDFVNQRIYRQPTISDNYYLRRPNKKTDFKVFHKIPSSSMLLTSYDPFYSPLLSRLDAIFKQLGYGNNNRSDLEKCRERLICLMYANPAKYAPYSNLVSAQLSRDLNELRKPSSDNADILRFFKYMKAARDGQDGEECLAHTGCSSLANHNQPSPALLTTYNEINKLVQARKLNG